MEKKNSFIIIVVIVIILVISGATILKVYNNHINNIYKVTTKKICEAVRNCYLDKKCGGNTVKIKDLVSYNYIENQVNPKTKEYISGDIIVYYENDNCQVDIK